MNSPLLWILVVAQIAMGLFDTVYHHELTERLAWRATQHRELALHAARNLIYALLFLTLGWLEPHGVFAGLIIAALLAEVIITLVDFVEEDVSRKLPATERVNHTLLAINYGAIMVLVLPVLFGWAAQETSMQLQNHGFMSLIATIAAIGVIGFGLRDMYTSRRSARLIPARAAELAVALPGRRHVLVTGGTGFIGRRLVEALASAGHRVTVLTRNPANAIGLHPGYRVIVSLDQIPNDEAIDGVINLAGEPIATGLWTLARRRRILRSRLRITRAVVRLLTRLETRPPVLIGGSAIGWYGLWQDEALTEFDGGKACFTHRVCEAWERSARRARALGVRVVLLRTGLVLGIEGGLLGQLLPPYEFGLGGPIGHGRQWMSWIERDDLVRLIVHLLATPGVSGPVNATAPTPVRNATFAAELGRALHRPAILRAPGAILHRLAGDFADELLLGGQQVLPVKAQESGFQFRHPTLSSALAGMLGSAITPESEKTLCKAPGMQGAH